MDVILIRGGDANICVRPLKNTTSTTPYFNPDAMVHVLLTLNEPLLQRSRPRGPLGLSLTTNSSVELRLRVGPRALRLGLYSATFGKWIAWIFLAGRFFFLILVSLFSGLFELLPEYNR